MNTANHPFDPTRVADSRTFSVEGVKHFTLTAERLEEGAMLYLHENDKLFAMIPMSDVRCREVIEILRGAA